MDAERWRRVDQLLQSALLVPPERRDEFLCRECAGDAALEGEVRSLLDSHSNAVGFLERPAIRVAAKAMAQADAGDAADSMCGRTFSHYQILNKLGAGGMGEVYRARDIRLDREVALKTVSLDLLSQKDALMRFEREARSASALNHPNIVTIYELGNVDGTHYIAMELVHGETVRALLSSGAIPFRKAVIIAAQIAEALAKAHEIGIVHRDLKPENLMVSSDGAVKVLDFGLAKLVLNKPSSDASTSISVEGVVVGTTAYMSPEQATGGDVDFRSDQFSLGSVLYEMVTGVSAFRKQTHAETVAAILRDEPERLAARMLQAPAPFVWIVERCLSKDPTQRYASTHDLARDLAAVRDRLADAPPRRSEPRPNNLPVQRTAFIGREQEETALLQLLSRADVRLVTLTGPGGIGKTRLALQVAANVGGKFPGGVCFVALAAITEPGLIASMIAQALEVHLTPNQSPSGSLKEYVGGLEQPMLLLLDNFEHLVSAAPEVAQLLAAGPNLKILVTSQAPLHVYGEHEFPVPQLALPDLKSIPPLEVLSHLPAVALFVERAQAVKREFALTNENAAAVAAICARLDGLPLAIELAAARIKLLSPSAMLARLESSLNLLTGGARDLPTRQQTLRGTVDWSYSLLKPAEQTFLRRLSVFTGGCTLEAAEAVCDTKGDLGLDVFDAMASMVDKSLVQHKEEQHEDEQQHVEEAGAEARFFMLSAIREYALERLAASEDESRTRRAHAAYYLVLAEEGSEDAAANPEWFDRFEVEHDNFRRALDYLIKTGDEAWGLRLGVALFRFWETREHLTEGREAIGRLLALPESQERLKLRARLLFAAAVLAGVQGDYRSAQRLFGESLDTSVQLNDDRGVAVSLNALGVNARDQGDFEVATVLFDRCIAIWKDLGDSADIARALSNLAGVKKLQREYSRSFELYDECLATFLQNGDEAGAAWTLNYLGDVAREKADFAAARSFCERSLAAFRQLHDGWGIASALSDLAGLSGDQGNNTEARRLYGESIKMFQDLGHNRGVARVLECLAANAAAQSDAVESLHVAGAAAALRQRLGAVLTPAEQVRLEKALEFARRTLGGAASLTAWMEGWAMPVDQAIREALNT